MTFSSWLLAMRRFPIQVIDGVLGKFCVHCDEWHPQADYYVQARGSWLCKKVHKKRQDKTIAKIIARDGLAQYMARRAAQVRKSVKKRRATDIRALRMREMLYSAKKRAKEKYLDFCISEKDFPGWRTLKYCPLFSWIELRWDRTRVGDDSPTIDRIDNEIGYIPGNVRLISFRANSLRQNGTAEEFLLLWGDASGASARSAAA